MKVLHSLTQQTGGYFGVALDEDHLRRLILDAVPPPALEQEPDLVQDPEEDQGGAELLCLGFPTRLPRAQRGKRTLCACHNKLRAAGYVCARCGAQLCDVPTDCAVCGLTAILSTHLARSYHHLLPVPPYQAVRWSALSSSSSSSSPKRKKKCMACHIPFPPMPSAHEQEQADAEVDQVEHDVANDQVVGDRSTTKESITKQRVYATSGRYRCAGCKNEFCLECDTYVHDVLHVCPGCV